MSEEPDWSTREEEYLEKAKQEWNKMSIETFKERYKDIPPLPRHLLASARACGWKHNLQFHIYLEELLK